MDPYKNNIENLRLQHQKIKNLRNDVDKCIEGEDWEGALGFLVTLRNFTPLDETVKSKIAFVKSKLQQVSTAGEQNTSILKPVRKTTQPTDMFPPVKSVDEPDEPEEEIRYSESLELELESEDAIDEIEPAEADQTDSMVDNERRETPVSPPMLPVSKLTDPDRIDRDSEPAIPKEDSVSVETIFDRLEVMEPAGKQTAPHRVERVSDRVGWVSKNIIWTSIIIVLVVSSVVLIMTRQFLKSGDTRRADVQLLTTPTPTYTSKPVFVAFTATPYAAPVHTTTEIPSTTATPAPVETATATATPTLKPSRTPKPAIPPTIKPKPKNTPTPTPDHLKQIIARNLDLISKKIQAKQYREALEIAEAMLNSAPHNKELQAVKADMETKLREFAQQLIRAEKLCKKRQLRDGAFRC